MTEEDLDRVHELKNELWTKVHDLVDEHLKDEKPEVAEEVREQMTEQFRFWERS